MLGTLGGLIAVAIGSYVARLWIVGSLARSLGWIVEVHVPWPAVFATLTAGIAVGVVAGLVCSHRVSSLSIREALIVSS